MLIKRYLAVTAPFVSRDRGCFRPAGHFVCAVFALFYAVGGGGAPAFLATSKKNLLLLPPKRHMGAYCIY